MMPINSKTKDPVGLHTLEVISKADQFNRWMYEQFRHQLFGDILEIGSGIGNISDLVISDGHSVTLSDYNKDYCSFLKKKYTGNDSVKAIIHLDLLTDDFENRFSDFKEKFDTIFLLNVIEHISDDHKAVNNCRHLLKPGGRLIILAPAGSWLYCSFDRELGHHRRYSMKSLSNLLTGCGYNFRWGHHFNFTGIAGWFLFGKLLKRKMIGNGEMSFFDKIVPAARMIDKLVGRKAGLSIIITGTKQ